MKYRRLGKSGLQLSEFSFGSWVTFGDQIGIERAKELLYVAYDSGVNYFDNAEGYARGQSEQMMGRIISEAGWRRDSYVVSSKVFFGIQEHPQPMQIGLSRKHVVEACHQALKRLRVEYLDLYFCHRPDKETPIEETVRAMNDLITQGKVLYWGTSEWSATEIMEAYAVAQQHHLVPPTMEQPQYNLFHRQRVEEEYAPVYETVGIGTTIWSPLASGVLSGKYSKDIPTDSRLALPEYRWLRDIITGPDKWKIPMAKRLAEVAAEIGIDLVHLSLAWCLKNPRVSTVILGASKPEQIKHNMAALDVVDKLDDAVMEQIQQIVRAAPPQNVN